MKSSLRQSLRSRLAKINTSVWSKVIFNGCLVFALFGGGFWQLFNFPDDPSNAILDVLMTLVFVIFCVEVALNLLVDRNYFLSFFFFMDCLGTISMIFEVSYILGVHGKMNTKNNAVDPVFMRTARVAKTASRAGRFLKLTKCLEMIIQRGGRHHKEGSSIARKLSAKLTFALSTKVSLLSIVMIIVIPLFQLGRYPEEDLSMMAWGQRLEEAYAKSYHRFEADATLTNDSYFNEVVENMRGFYSNVDYYPYKLEGYPEDVTIDGRAARIPGAKLLGGALVPDRLQNILKQEVSQCLVARPGCEGSLKAAVYINFEDSKRREDAIDMVLALFVIGMMVGLTSNLSSTIVRLVVQPLERMLLMVREIGSTILELPTEDPDGQNGDKLEDLPEESPDETALLEKAFDKLRKISSIALQDNVVDTKGMTDEALGVVVGIMSMRTAQPTTGRRSRTSGGPRLQHIIPAGSIVAKLDIPVSEVDSWDLDLLKLDGPVCEQIMLHIFFDSGLGAITGRAFCDVPTFQAFYADAMAGYFDQPYHNATHAKDVTHTVYQLCGLTRADQWISDVELYALLVAALCHDIGHLGRANPFLVATGHELALQYNDASPLENMHCACLFKLCARVGRNMFKALDDGQYRVARKTCIATILHTDNANHFDMVKGINKCYEIASEIIERQAKHGDVAQFTGAYLEVLQKETLMFLELFLHLSDISNPLKPFPVSQAWAWRVLDEFFAQGDEEKALGIPVGMLNDRDKVNRPGSQHGFINFLVAPLVFGSVKIFPPLHILSTQMACNVKAWRDVWVEEASPDEEAVAKRDVDVQKIDDAAQEMVLRVLARHDVPSDRGGRSSRVYPMPTPSTPTSGAVRSNH